MIKKLNITILVDNQSNNAELLSEHGLAIWIEADDHRILFDTGQSEILIHNAAVLGMDLSSADTLILSHGHYDHTGGVRKVLELNPGINTYCHPNVFVPRYSKKEDGRMKPIGINKFASDALHRRIDAIHWVTGPTYVDKGIGITGPIPRKTKFEDTGGDFYLDQDALRPDNIDDDLSIWFNTSKGVVVLTGCCHSGLINTLKRIQELNENEKIHALVGGLHLVNASGERISASMEYLKSIHLNHIYPCHCTGSHAIETIKNEVADRMDLLIDNSRPELHF